MRKKGVFERQQLCVNIRNRGLRGVAGGRLRPELCLTFSSICPDSVLFFYHPLSNTLSNTHTHTHICCPKFKEMLQSVEFWRLVRDEALTGGDILRSWIRAAVWSEMRHSVWWHSVWSEMRHSEAEKLSWAFQSVEFWWLVRDGGDILRSWTLPPRFPQSTTIEQWLPIRGNFLSKSTILWKQAIWHINSVNPDFPRELSGVVEIFARYFQNICPLFPKIFARYFQKYFPLFPKIFPAISKNISRYFQWQTFGQRVTSSLTLPPLGCLGSNRLPFYQSLQQIKLPICCGDITSKNVFAKERGLWNAVLHNFVFDKTVARKSKKVGG